MISHPATASPDSRSTASQIEFATGTIDEQAPAMPADPESPPPPEPDRLEAATDQAITACGGNARNAVKALIVANEFLEEQVEAATGRRIEWLRAWQIRSRTARPQGLV